MATPKVESILTVTTPRPADIKTIEKQQGITLKSVVGFTDAWVSRCGKIIKLHYPLTGDAWYYYAALTPRRADQRPMVTLKGKEGNTMRTLSGIVARAYLDNPEDITRFDLINIDGDRGNCAADNLKWKLKAHTTKHYYEVKDTRTGSIMEFDTKKDFQDWVNKTFTFSRKKR
tara:strand:+ start:139 stop:657 length:519 start_codon:yes stop_codon:yes gene_type:complete